MIGALWRLVLASLLAAMSLPAVALDLDRAPGVTRIATFNANLVRKGAGVLLQDIRARDPQVLAAAEIILRVRPDILLINELDHDEGGAALDAFCALLADGVAGLPGLSFPGRLIGPMNTGVPTGFDLNGDGTVMGARDAHGFGRFPGQYGMALLVAEGLRLGETRDFHRVRWADAPWAAPPTMPDGAPYYAAEVWAALRLSSKSHWDARVSLADGHAIHLLASHPTPPVFDGPEDRNGLRNAAEIRFWSDYIDGADWMRDASGRAGGLAPDASFVVLGDLNADPDKGDGDRATLRRLLDHARVRDPAPRSPGAAALGDATDTADWPEVDGPGNLRVDYVLPSANLAVTGSGVFWPAPDHPLARLTSQTGKKRASSDHRLVWVDIAPEKE